MTIRVRTRGALRGVLAGIVAGLVWWLVDAATNRLLGGVVPTAVAWEILALDVGVGAAGGALIGGLMPGTPLGGVALGLAVVHGFVRVFLPPGMGVELVYLLVAPPLAAIGTGIAGRDRDGFVAFVQLSVVAAVVATVGEYVLTDPLHVALRGFREPLVIASFPLVAVVLDRLLGLAVSRRGARLALELAAAVVAGLVWGRPLSFAPLIDPVVTAVPPPAGTPDVILVSLDTTRADHLSTYGYARETSPHLTEFAKDALLFSRAYSTGGWTLPAHASVFTGQYPSRHGAHLAGGWLAGQSIDGRRNVAYPLADDRTTLAEILRDRGYQTAGIAANFSYLYRDFGVAQGFGRWEDAPGILLKIDPAVVRFARATLAPSFALKPFRTAPDVTTAALDWLDHAPAGRPAFLFVNYMEPHQPWLAPPPYDRWVQGIPDAARLARENVYTHEVRAFGKNETDFITANYDGQLAAMDAGFAALVDGLKARGRYENALIVVFGDHGDLLGEHGQIGHMGRMLYEGLVHVPLLVKYPGTDHRRGTEANPVQLVDILPTVARIAGAPIPDGVQGQDVLAVSHPIVAEEDINPYLVAEHGAFYDRAIRVLTEWPYKLVRTSRDEEFLYNLEQDPAEDRSLTEAEPDRARALAQRLEAMLKVLVADNGGHVVN